MIDHTRAFKIFKELKDREEPGDALCARDFLAALRALDQPTLGAAMKGLLTEGQVDGLLARRDKIVEHYETQDRGARRGVGALRPALARQRGDGRQR